MTKFEIKIENLGKRFNREWIFRNLNKVFESGKSYAVTGPNGSGKSTLLQVISGIMPFSEGNLQYIRGKRMIQPDDFYKELSIATPYQELIEEFTLREHLSFHRKLKPLKGDLNDDDFFDKLMLGTSANKEIRFFSSGMKQRVKLGLAMYSDSPVLLLDEPTTNLDSQGVEWYLNEIKKCLQDRIVIICSNQRYEFDFCDEVIEIRK